MRDPNTSDAGELRRRLVQHFSDNDLRSLCQDLAVDYEQLPGQGSEAKARELIAWLEQRDRLADLRAAAAHERPHVAWGAAGGEPAASPTPPAARQSGARVVIRGNALIGKANRITVAQPDVSVEENLLAGQEQAIDVSPNETGAQQP
jgi:hypothetical protein